MTKTATAAPEFFITRCRNGHVHQFTDAQRISSDHFIAWSGKFGATRCANCGTAERFQAIRVRVTKTECGPRCTSAVGPACDCKCGGRNHAAGHGALAFA
jgi:hypothetical protein